MKAGIRAATVIAAAYARSAAERVYDAGDDSSIGAQLRGLSPLQKRAVELLLHTASALLDAKASEATPLTLFVKQVLGDASSEIARRMLAVNEAPRPDNSTVVHPWSLRARRPLLSIQPQTGEGE